MIQPSSNLYLLFQVECENAYPDLGASEGSSSEQDAVKVLKGGQILVGICA